MVPCGVVNRLTPLVLLSFGEISSPLAQRSLKPTCSIKKPCLNTHMCIDGTMKHIEKTHLPGQVGHLNTAPNCCKDYGQLCVMTQPPLNHLMRSAFQPIQNPKMNHWFDQKNHWAGWGGSDFSSFTSFTFLLKWRLAFLRDMWIDPKKNWQGANAVT